MTGYGWGPADNTGAGTGAVGATTAGTFHPANRNSV